MRTVTFMDGYVTMRAKESSYNQPVGGQTYPDYSYYYTGDVQEGPKGYTRLVRQSLIFTIK